MVELAEVSNAQGCTFCPLSAASGELLPLLGHIQPDLVSGNPESLRNSWSSFRWLNISFSSEIGEERMPRNMRNAEKTFQERATSSIQGAGGLWKQSIGYTAHDGGPRGSRVSIITTDWTFL